jgi:hypothetical protein
LRGLKARLAGYPCGSDFRNILTELQRPDPPLVLRTPDGYRRPAK